MTPKASAFGAPGSTAEVLGTTCAVLAMTILRTQTDATNNQSWPNGHRRRVDLVKIYSVEVLNDSIVLTMLRIKPLGLSLEVFHGPVVSVICDRGHAQEKVSK